MAVGSVITYRFRLLGDVGSGADAVIAFNQGQEFALGAIGKPSAERYLLSPAPGGTTVTYRFDMVGPIPYPWPGSFAVRSRAVAGRKARKHALLMQTKARLEGGGAASA